jgi:hypothetical protein
MLTWAYFYFKWYKPLGKDGLGFPVDESDLNRLCPLFTRYVHLWDTWKWKNHPDRDKIEEFITAMMARTDFNDPTSIYWDSLNDNQDHVAELCQSGMFMLDFRDGYGEMCCESIGKTIEFDGFRCFACNIPKSNSEWYNSVEPKTYDNLMPFYYNMQTGKFVFSLYTSNPAIDVSKIAQKYGGGGHCGAAGFQCEELPF